MNDDFVFADSTLVVVDPKRSAELERLVRAVDRQLAVIPPSRALPDDAVQFEDVESLKRAMEAELQRAADESPNPLDRQPGENRKQHRARVRRMLQKKLTTS